MTEEKLKWLGFLDSKNFLSKVLTTGLKKLPKDFALQEGTASKRVDTRLREKHAAEMGWKQDVSKWPVEAGADLAMSHRSGGLEY